ncbi:NB-ARC domains-containing protein [Artemisia annua]|uniref:NB-ARC domains-containing protein n=1 Tax=Artemisia annua TaxID=35608 RepID=A0A2U1QCS1_ARTAN|nr:NB-ARC domains-containing protein [Artemisia annua]
MGVLDRQKMVYTGLELFMDNLRQLCYSNNNPLINNNPSVLSKRPQFLLLYNELSFMIQIIFVEKQNEQYESEQVRNLKRRFEDVAQEAHSIVGVFLYSINYRNKRPVIDCFTKYITNYRKGTNSIYNTSLNLKNVMKAINSIKEEFINLKRDSSTSIGPLNKQTASETSHTRHPLGLKEASQEMVVGLEHDIGLIRDQLSQDQKELDVVSIVGMGGLGKTTLANKVFNDPFIVYHFHVRAWVTVSQRYERRGLLIQILAFMDVQLDPASASDSQLRQKLHKSLMGKRYLIVIDDIWSIDAWNDLKLIFPNNQNGSRILLTSRLKEVALNAKVHGFVHQLECLTDEQSWELLCNKVFRGHDCPEMLINPGIEIAKKCHGLPLAVVVIAGVLTREAADKESWERVRQKASSYIVSERNGCVDILTFSYEHLPPHLKDCFLYLGGFPEDHKFRVRKLIWLWVAEGFIQQIRNQSLEETAEDYLIELVDRNLVVVDREFNGAIKAFSVHDILRELCLERAKKVHFCLKITTSMNSFDSIVSYKPRRIFTDEDFFNQRIPWVQSLLCFYKGWSLISNRGVRSYPLLTVLDIQSFELAYFPEAIGLLVHLRYLAFWYTKGFPSLICNLWSLLTIIVKCSGSGRLYLPNTISKLVNLRHLWSDGYIYFPLINKQMNLQTISNVALEDAAGSWVRCFPGIKKLTCTTFLQKNEDFDFLNSLDTLMWINITTDHNFRKIPVTFPDSLKKLSLSGCCLPWSDMSIIQMLPNLEVLKILEHAFLGPTWETGEVQFQKLKFLKLQGLNIKHWEASCINFPCLTHLVLDVCQYLEAIPLEIGDIPTLELIDIDDSSSLIFASLSKIQEEQQNFGNYDLKINVRKVIHRLSLYRKLRGVAWMVDW